MDKLRSNTTRRRLQEGSALLYVLIGVVLFAALSYVVARGMRSQSTQILDDRQVELRAADILAYAQDVQRAVSRLRSRTVGENDICFYHPDWGHVTYNGCLALTQNQVFHADGGGAKFSLMDSDWIDPSVLSSNGEYGYIMYTGYDAVTGVGTDGASNSNQELLMTFPYIRPEICTYINKKLGLPYNPVPTDATGFHPAASLKRFTGTYVNGGSSTVYASATTALQGKTSACVRRANYYVYYNVLIAR